MPGPGGSCLVDRAGGAPLSVLIVPPPFGRLDIVDDRPAALLFVADLARRQAEQLDRFRRRHALTPAEARFVAEIAKGDGLKAAGQRLGITLGTARTHLTHVFEKTGTRRQAELVGLLLQTEAAPASA